MAQADKKGGGMFVNLINWIEKNKIHPPPKNVLIELELLKEINENGQGYLTKRTETEPYCRVVFFYNESNGCGK